jgi:mRNA interferase MazF
VIRGEVWALAGGQGYAGKPRPVLIVQDELYGETNSITFCGFTSTFDFQAVSRPEIEADAVNGLDHNSCVMVDKIMTTQRKHAGKKIGTLSANDMALVDQALLVFLGLVR